MLCKYNVSSKADHLNYFSKTFKTCKRQHSLIPSQSDNGCVWVAMILLLWLMCILTTSPDWSFNNSGEPDQNIRHTDKFTTETQTHVNLKRKHYAIEILSPKHTHPHIHTHTRALIQNTHTCTPTHLWLFTSALAASADTSPFSMFCVGVGRRLEVID